MPAILESGMLQLSSVEAADHKSAADRLHESCLIPLDLAKPITIEQWLLLSVAHAAQEGDLEPLNNAIAVLEAEISSRTRPS